MRIALFLLLQFAQVTYSSSGVGPGLNFTVSLKTFPQSQGVYQAKNKKGIWTARAVKLPENKTEEMRNRENNFRLIEKINFSNELRLELKKNSNLKKLFQEFHQSDVGAYWFSLLAKDNIKKLNNGYFEIAKDLNPFKIYEVFEILTGQLNWPAFDAKAELVFRFDIFYGYGAFGSKSHITIGNLGFRKLFPGNCQKVDPIAILSHEFGHTRFSSITESHTLQGEREVVRLYENPVRRMNGHDDRVSYYSTDSDQTIFTTSGEIRPGLWRRVDGNWVQADPKSLCPQTLENP